MAHRGAIAPKRKKIIIIIIVIIIIYYAPEWRSRYSDSLRAGRSGDRIPVAGRDILSRPDRLWSPPILLYNGFRVSFPGVNRPGRGLDHPPNLASRSKEQYSYSSTPPLGLRGLFHGELYLYLYYVLRH